MVNSQIPIGPLDLKVDATRPAQCFPRPIREMLRRAVQTDVLTPLGRSPARAQAIDAAVAVARRECPHFFRKV